MRKLILITLLLFAVIGQAQQDPKSYSFSLDQAIAHALQHNYSVINSGRDIQIAEKKRWETTAAGLPQISAGVDYTNNFDLQQSLVPAEFFGGNAGEFVAVAFGTKHNMNAHANLNQLLFDGSYIVALQASKVYLQYYTNYKQKTDNEVRAMVTFSYGNVLVVEENIAILEKNKSTLEKTLNETVETFKNGLIEEENVEQLQITLASVTNDLNNSKRLLDIAYKMLKVDLGIDIVDTVKLTDKLSALTTDNLALVFSQEEFNLENNIDYKIGTNFRDQRRLELKLERSRFLPTLGASLNYGYLGYGDKFNYVSADQDWFKYSSLGVNLNIPVFSSGARRARVQQAQIEFEKAKTQLTETEQKLKLQYAEAKSNYEFSIEQYETAKSNLNLAERIEGKQQVKFTEGLSTSFDFATAQRQLYTAQENYLRSMINVINRKAELEKITNSTIK